MAKNASSQLGPVIVQTDDPGFQPPHDPLKVGDTKSRAGLVYRDIPLVQVQNTWSVQEARNALYSHQIGIFEQSGQLCDSLLGDPRVMATTRSRVTALFGRPVKFTPADDSDAAREVCDAWARHWPRFSGTYALHLAHTYSIHMGWSACQVTWDTSGELDLPFLRFWHPRFSYYNWALRKYIALSQDGQIAIEPGNAKWLLHAPHGDYRGWVYGAIRAITEPWLYRHFAARDMARFSEVHGLPTRVGIVPAASDPIERSNFESALAALGSDSAMIVPQGVDGTNSYDYKLVEATDNAWQSFPGMMDRADMDIVLAILMVNLTTEVKVGSFAATDAHMDKERGGTEFDNQAWKSTISNQVARPFAFMNYGDPDLAPWTEWDIKSREETDLRAKGFQAFGTAVEVLRRGGVKFKNVEELRAFATKTFDLQQIPDFELVDPVAGGMGGSK
jgi:phage gp29-like protein